MEGALPDRVTKAECREHLERTHPFYPTLINLLGKEINTLPKTDVFC